MELSVDQLGLDELEKKMKAVTFDAKKKGGRFALRKAAQVIRDDARKRASRVDNPATQSSIPGAITERWNGRLFKRTENLGFRIGVKGGAKVSDDPSDTGHWRYVEFGTSRMAAQPFMRPALSENVGEATTEFAKQYKKALDRAIKKGRTR